MQFKDELHLRSITTWSNGKSPSMIRPSLVPGITRGTFPVETVGGDHTSSPILPTMRDRPEDVVREYLFNKYAVRAHIYLIVVRLHRSSPSSARKPCHRRRCEAQNLPTDKRAYNISADLRTNVQCPHTTLKRFHHTSLWRGVIITFTGCKQPQKLHLVKRLVSYWLEQGS